MNSHELIQDIRTIVKYKKAKHDIDSFLKRHNCDILCLDKEVYLEKYEKNRKIIIERFLASKEFIEGLKVPYALFKGAVLSKQLYKDPFARNSGDIDLLFCIDNYSEIKNALTQAGFVQGRFINGKIEPVSRRQRIFQTSMTHQIPSFVKVINHHEDMCITIDLNHNLMWGENKEKLETSRVLKYVEDDEICGVKYKKLIPEMDFIAICLHHYKDMNSFFQLIKGHYRLKLFWEIYKYLIEVQPDTKKLNELCGILSVGAYVYYCIYYVQIIFEDSRLEEYLSSLCVYREDGIMDTYGLNEEERKKWGMPFEERLISEVLPLYVYNNLTEKEKENINKNIKYM